MSVWAKGIDHITLKGSTAFISQKHLYHKNKIVYNDDTCFHKGKKKEKKTFSKQLSMPIKKENIPSIPK